MGLYRIHIIDPVQTHIPYTTDMPLILYLRPLLWPHYGFTLWVQVGSLETD